MIFRRHRSEREAGLFGESRMERLAETTADRMGTSAFLVISTIIIFCWITYNSLTALQFIRFDPYPFILLNLMFSAQAFYTGALVIIAQKAQAKRALADSLADAAHREQLHGELKELIEANTDLTSEVHGLVHALVRDRLQP